jgi:hypothetical protein
MRLNGLLVGQFSLSGSMHFCDKRRGFSPETSHFFMFLFMVVLFADKQTISGVILPTQE